MIDEFTLRYPSFGPEQGRCQVFLDTTTNVAVAVEVPENRSTSVTNAVEQVVKRIRDHARHQVRLFTIAPFGPFEKWGVFEVKFGSGGQPEWDRVRSFDSPEVLGRAMRWAERAWGPLNYEPR
jgi:hypothetical protein